MEGKIDIFTHHYFPYYFIILGIVFIPVIVIPVYPFLSVGLFILSFLMITTHYRLRIDMKQQTFMEYVWIFGLKRGKELPLPEIDHLFVNRVARDEEYGLVARLSTHKIIYIGFIKLSDGETLFFGESRKEERLLKHAKKLAGVLQTEIRKNY